MTINITFVLQMVNFLIAYWCMNRLFFKPVLESIAEEDAQMQLYMHDMHQATTRLEEARRALQEQWCIYRQKIRSLVVAPVGHKELLNTSSDKRALLSDKVEEEKLLAELTKRLVAKAQQ